MTICFNPLTGKNTEITNITKENDFFLITKDPSDLQLSVIFGILEIPKGIYKFKHGKFWIRQHQINFQGEALWINLNDPTIVTVKPGGFFQPKPQDKIFSQAILQITNQFNDCFSITL